jgi:hypothetical protein
MPYLRRPLRSTKASLQGKAPTFPEEDMEQRKKDYLAFLLGEDIQTSGWLAGSVIHTLDL